MNRSIFLLTTVLGSIPLCGANDLSSLYPAATLNSWTQRYQRSSTKILDEIIWPVLFENEKALFGGRKPVLEFPLPPKVIDDARGNPLAFYSFGDRDLVVFPVLSLKFLDDLCTAYAWLQTNGYGLETISEYTAILRYGSPPAGGFPAPLDALGIPQNALNDADVNDLALGHFVTARTFILLHEMGHILEARSNSISADPIQNEEWADRFAATIMQRTPLRPLGMVIYFLANAHWSSYPASASDTHPLSGKRVLTLASRMDDPVLAMKLRELGVKFFDDPLVRQGFAATGQAGNFQALAPRRPNELPRLGTIQRSGNSVAFDGLYQGQFVQFSDPTEAMEIEVSLRRTRDNVTGHYTFGLGVGTLSGTAVGNHLYFEWQWGQNFGKGVFEARGGNSFAGTWGYRESRTNAGTWNGSHQ
jgi:hypothetical protein